MKTIFYGTSTNGVFIPIKPYDYRKALLSLEDKEIEVTVGKKRKTRSNEQNRYYHGIVVKLISEHTGFTPAETHEVLKSKFLKEFITFKNKDYEITKSTTRLTTKEFM